MLYHSCIIYVSNSLIIGGISLNDILCTELDSLGMFLASTLFNLLSASFRGYSGDSFCIYVFIFFFCG